MLVLPGTLCMTRSFGATTLARRRGVLIVDRGDETLQNVLGEMEVLGSEARGEIGVAGNDGVCEHRVLLERAFA